MIARSDDDIRSAIADSEFPPDGTRPVASPSARDLSPISSSHSQRGTPPRFPSGGLSQKPIWRPLALVVLAFVLGLAFWVALIGWIN